jgi:hypothetical protein
MASLKPADYSGMPPECSEVRTAIYAAMPDRFEALVNALGTRLNEDSVAATRFAGHLAQLQVALACANAAAKDSGLR